MKIDGKLVEICTGDDAALCGISSSVVDVHEDCFYVVSSAKASPALSFERFASCATLEWYRVAFPKNDWNKFFRDDFEEMDIHTVSLSDAIRRITEVDPKILETDFGVALLDGSLHAYVEVTADRCFHFSGNSFYRFESSL